MIRTLGSEIYRIRAVVLLITILGLWIPATALSPAHAWNQKEDGRNATPGRHEVTPTSRHSPSRRLEAPVSEPSPPLFLPVVTLDSGGTSNNDVTGPVAIADLNGDGTPDLVMPNPCAVTDPKTCDGLLSVFLGKSDSTFEPSVSYGSGAYWAEWVTVADVNNDKKLDLVVANGTVAGGSYGPGVVSVLLGNGDGTFQPAVTYDSGDFGATSVAVGDLNRDGKPDVVVTNNNMADSGEGTASVLLGNGDGTFQAAVSYDAGGWGAGSAVLADVNGDRKLDVLVTDVCTPLNGACNTKGVAGVFLGNGDGTLKPVVPYDSGGFTAVSMAVADLNRDGRPDLITFNSCNVGCTGGGIGVLLGNGDGTFQPAVTYLSGGSGGLPGMAAVADIDGDGQLDIVANTTSPLGSGVIGVLLGNGDGTLKAPVTYDAGGALGTSITTAKLAGTHGTDLILTECPMDGCGIGDLHIGLLLHVGTVTTHVQEVSSLNPSVFGQSVTFTATVTSSSGTPTGKVKFFDSSTLLGTGTLTNGSTSISVANLNAASHSIASVYQGSLKYNSSISQSLSQVVNIASTATSLTSSANPILVNHPVTYTANVTPQAGGPISGSVIFHDGASQYTAGVVGNLATVKVTYKTTGVRTVSATYSGDSNNTGSTSSLLEEGVLAVTTTHLSTSGSPSIAGQPVTFTATVTSKYGPIPDGEPVSFLDGKKVLGSVSVSGGTAAFTTSTLSAKTHTIKAVYGGDSNFKNSLDRVTQVVNAQ